MFEEGAQSGHCPLATMQSNMRYRKKHYLRKEEMKCRRDREQCKKIKS